MTLNIIFSVAMGLLDMMVVYATMIISSYQTVECKGLLLNLS
jgi:hypothetical protein